ncbi:hypothetical protein OG979_00645 [Actinomadura citrea]|uniref:hypothetical protein n=1 Tax=Actinomadura citrea TaxID=46158 RepID=UPI002E2A7938|nr:hypothetical protein [Actinomadura citrea]
MSPSHCRSPISGSATSEERRFAHPGRRQCSRLRAGLPTGGSASSPFITSEKVHSAVRQTACLPKGAILWFAGASATAGLINIVPRYLPRYGMAPDWARATRPLVLICTVVSFAIILLFGAQVETQGGAYATGVLALILSAAVAATLAAWKRRRRRTGTAFGVVTLILVYATAANIIERPDGLVIAVLFCVAIVVTSLISRATRSTELRITDVDFDPVARRFLDKAEEAWELHRLPATEGLLFLELTVSDASEFESTVRVTGEERHGYRILRTESPSIANAIAAILLHIQHDTGKQPHVYFHWAEGNPIGALLRYLVFGGGDIPPLTREILRQAEPDIEQRPIVHVG